MPTPDPTPADDPNACPVCRYPDPDPQHAAAVGALHTYAQHAAAVAVAPLARHLHPDACHICGTPKADHPHPLTAGDVYWSNAAAAHEASAHDAKVRAAGGPVYSSGARTPEAAYVAEHRPY